MNLTRSVGTPDSTRILYNTSRLTESQAFLKSTNSWCTFHCAPILSPASDDAKKNVNSSWSVTSKFTMVTPNNFVCIWTYPWRRIFGTISYDVHNSDKPRWYCNSFPGFINWIARTTTTTATTTTLFLNANSERSLLMGGLVSISLF
jgi:hypothetical protein